MSKSNRSNILICKSPDIQPCSFSCRSRVEFAQVHSVVSVPGEVTIGLFNCASTFYCNPFQLPFNHTSHYKTYIYTYMGKIFFWHYSIKIIGNFLICRLLLNWFFSIKFYQIFSNRKMSIINRKISIKFQNIWRNSISYIALCCQKVKVQNWSS